MESIIKARDVVKVFGNEHESTTVLDGVDLDIERGEFVAVMGSSGSGKSTLLFALSGMDEITSGSVLFDGVDLGQIDENERADIRRDKMGFVFQQPTMLKNLTLLDNIIIAVYQGAGKGGDAITERARTLMQRMGIGGLENRDIKEVSGGQLQRASVCRALMASPDIVFADEPTGALNSQSADEVLALFGDINADGTTILVVTHDAKVAATARRVLFMKDGVIVSDLVFSGQSEDLEQRIGEVMRYMAAIGI